MMHFLRRIDEQYLCSESTMEIWWMESRVIFFSISLEKFNDQDTFGNYSPDLCCLMLPHGLWNLSSTNLAHLRRPPAKLRHRTISTHRSYLHQWLHPWSSTRWNPSKPWFLTSNSYLSWAYCQRNRTAMCGCWGRANKSLGQQRGRACHWIIHWRERNCASAAQVDWQPWTSTWSWLLDRRKPKRNRNW